MKKNILLIGVGGTGSNAVDAFFKKYRQMGNQIDNKVTALVFDTDAGDLKRITSAKTVVMADTASVGTICDRIGKNYLRQWFPCDAEDIRAQEMQRGASQWRKKSYLAFLNLMNKTNARSTFTSALEDMVQDPAASCEIYVIASVAGGTGSGSFIPIALYAKRYLRKMLGKDPIVNAMIALPDIYAESQTPENKVKVYSNAYAILRELNAINMVSRNYNAGTGLKKKAPVKFKIGHENDGVGVLFDASDKHYWTPEAAPFSQVFLLDRIPGLNSIAAHDMVLADSLYTIVCTEIGAAFDSEFSNHELVRSQNNGSNAIYAGISTSQIRFPIKSVLEYLACKKTKSSCENEWVILHNNVENKIKEKEREAKAAKRRFVMADSEYAEMVLKAAEELQNENKDELISIVERCVEQYDENGKRINKSAGEFYIETIDSYIMSRIPDTIRIKEDAENYFPAEKAYPKPTAKDVVDLVSDTLPTAFLEYFRECLEAVKCVPVSTSDAVITLNKKKIGTIGERYALYNNLLTTKDQTAIHPVAALIRLCQFRVKLNEKLSQKIMDWPEIKHRVIDIFPSRYYNNLKPVDDKYIGKSVYAGLGAKRFELVHNKAEENYTGKKTKAVLDLAQLKIDTETIINKIHADTLMQISYKVYSAIAKDVDLLISKYRYFFSRFEKEREYLDEMVKDARRKNSGAIDSVINVYSSEEDKDEIDAIINEGNGPETESDIIATDDIVGLGVWNTVFASAVADASNDDSFNNNDSGAYRSIFTCMIDAYRSSISKSEIFKNVASYNAIEAIVAPLQEISDEELRRDKIEEALRAAFSVAQERAVPSLMLDRDLADKDLITPSSIMVFMLSLNTAKYIKRNAELFGLKIPADQNSEESVLRSCAEQFVRDYSGNSSARVAIVKTSPDHILYCTGEIMDITPLCISKFNELGKGNDNVYFMNYCEALERFRKYDTDMWNPHIGYNLHKRGYLPFMNPDMEEECDNKMVKALLYALKDGCITYSNGTGVTGYKDYYFIYENNKIRTGDDKQPIDAKNISQLLNWLRTDDEDVVAKWSKSFDEMIESTKQSLPAIISDNEISVIESALSSSDFMEMLNVCLYVDKKASKEKGKDAKISALELAYRIKTCEEIERDCDDAERVLRVLYSVFTDIIKYRISPETNPERFIQVYDQQLLKFYEALAGSEAVAKAGKNCDNYYAQLVAWLNDQKLFLFANPQNAVFKDGELTNGETFKKSLYSPAITTILNKTAKRREDAKADEEE